MFGMDIGMIIAFLIYISLTIMIYLIPTIIALDKRHIDTLAIFILNLLLGWTFVGWVIAMVWACKKSNSQIN